MIHSDSQVAWLATLPLLIAHGGMLLTAPQPAQLTSCASHVSRRQRSHVLQICHPMYQIMETVKDRARSGTAVSKKEFTTIVQQASKGLP